MQKPSYVDFDNKNYYWKSSVDYRSNPELYKVGKGEQGVLICQPYKSEIGAHWRFKTPEIAEISSNKIYEMFIEYLNQKDFVGADLARKYLQMGFTRSRRYRNYKGGKKYDKVDNNYVHLEKGTGSEEKEVCATIFYKLWQEAEKNILYKKWKAEWKSKYG